MWTRAFWGATLERALRTFAQVAIAIIGVTAAAGGGVDAVDWGNVGSVSLLASILSVGMSLTAGAVSSNPGPSFGSNETLNPTPPPAPRKPAG